MPISRKTFQVTNVNLVREASKSFLFLYGTMPIILVFVLRNPTRGRILLLEAPFSYLSIFRLIYTNGGGICFFPPCVALYMPLLYYKMTEMWLLLLCFGPSQSGLEIPFLARTHTPPIERKIKTT